MENERKYSILLEELKQRWNILHYNHVAMGKQIDELKKAIEFVATTRGPEMAEFLAKIDIAESTEIENESQQS